MRIDRRGLLALIGAGAATPAMARGGVQGEAAFLHGVASGDPGPDTAVLWTRVTPPDPASGPVEVILEIAEDAGFADARRVRLSAAAERDFTVKHLAEGLTPGHEHHYRFRSGEAVSPVGRVKTLPVGATPDVVLAVASCQLHPGGLFNAYEAMAGLERLDAVVHLGDYIYEYGAAEDDYGMATGARLNRLPDPPREIVTLSDYRRRHAQYKSDPDLQAAHARAAFICVWDDHEVANDTWMTGAENHQPESEGGFAARKAAALRAYYEWMPIREPGRGVLAEAIHRSFDFGDLATLAMVETRLTARTAPLSYADLTFTAGPDGTPVPDIAAFEARRHDPARELLGAAQRDWLGRTLSASRAAGRPWQVLGNQVVMGRVRGPDVAAMVPAAQLSALLETLPETVRPQVEQAIALFRLGLPFNLDSWDGFPADRERLYALFAQAGVRPIVLSGDSHAFWVNTLKDASGARRAVEFGTSAVSSPSPGDMVAGLPLGPALTAANEEVVFCDQTAKGFVRLTLTRERATAELMAVSTLFSKPFETRVAGRYEVVRQDDGPGVPTAL